MRGLFGEPVSLRTGVPHAGVMTEQQTPTKKNQMAGNLAGAALILGLIGVLLEWRASNMETASGAGVLFIAIAGVLLIASLVSHMLRPKR